MWTYFGDGIVWGDGTTQVPSEFRSDDSYCPFNEKDVSDSEIGYNITFSMGIMIIMLTVLLTLIIWRKWRNVEVYALRTKEILS